MDSAFDLLIAAAEASKQADAPTGRADMKARAAYEADVRKHAELLSLLAGFGRGGAPEDGAAAAPGVASPPSLDEPVPLPDAGDADGTRGGVPVDACSTQAGFVASPSSASLVSAVGAKSCLADVRRRFARNAERHDSEADREATIASQFRDAVAELEVPTLQARSEKTLLGLVPLAVVSSRANRIHEEAKDHGALADLKHTFTKSQTAIAICFRGAREAAAALQAHVGVMQRAKARQASQQQQDAEREALKEERERLKEQAQQLQSDRTKSIAPCIFSSVTALDGVSEIVRLDQAELTREHFSKRFVLSSGSCISAFQANQAVQAVMGKWPTEYKKDEKYLVDKTHSCALLPKFGKQEAEAMFSSILAPVKDTIVDSSDISPPWGQASWVFGNAVGHHSCNVAPSSAGLLKYLSMGEIAVSCFDISTIKEAIPTAGGMKEFADSVKRASSEILSASGAEIYSTTLAKGEMVFIPSAWFINELTLKRPLVFGVWQSVFLKAPGAAKAYGQVSEMIGRRLENAALV